MKPTDARASIAVDLGANRLDNPGATVLPNERGVGRLVDQGTYPRQGLRPRNPGIP